MLYVSVIAFIRSYFIGITYSASDADNLEPVRTQHVKVADKSKNGLRKCYVICINKDLDTFGSLSLVILFSVM